MEREALAGYALSEREFARLLDDEPSRAEILGTLSGWGIALDPADPASVAAAHDLVQSDPGRQRAVYQVAMRLWR